MCTKFPLENIKLDNRYSSFEKSTLHAIEIDCSGCSPKKIKRCMRRRARKNRGSDSTLTPMRKQGRLSRRSRIIPANPPVREGHLLNKYEGFRPIQTGKTVNGRPKVIIERIQYGRHKDYINSKITDIRDGK